MRSRACSLAAGAALTLLLSGCAGHARSQKTLEPLGRKVFAAKCAGCHTLTGRDTRAPGGDLAIAKLSEKDIASFARIMPARLSSTEVGAVAAYIHAAATRSTR